MHRINRALLEVRVLHGFFVITILLFIFVIFQANPQEQPLEKVIPLAVAAVNVATIFAGVILRSRILTPSVGILRSNPGNTQALGRWRLGQLLSFTLAESIALFGLALKFVGADWKTVGPFFAASILLLLFWIPKLDVAPTG